MDIFSVPQKYLEIRCSTWAEDLHGLFDYDQSKVTMADYLIDCSSYLFRKENNLVVATNKQEIDKTLKYLAFIQSIHCENNLCQKQILQQIVSLEKFFFVPKLIQSDNEELITENPDQSYLVVRSLRTKDNKEKGYDLLTGDIIKLGKLNFRILEIKNNYSITKANIEFYNPKIEVKKLLKQNQIRKSTIFSQKLLLRIQSVEYAWNQTQAQGLQQVPAIAKELANTFMFPVYKIDGNQNQNKNVFKDKM